MDMPRSEVRDLRFDQFSVTKHLERASAQARARNYQDFLIVDVDSHHYENESYKDLFQYIDNPVIRRAAIESTKRPGRSSLLNSQVGYQDTGGRITRHELRKYEKVPADTHRDITMTKLWMDAMGVDYACLFPTPMLFLGLHPQVEVETPWLRKARRECSPVRGQVQPRARRAISSSQLVAALCPTVVS
jgi:hypothetical protein